MFCSWLLATMSSIVKVAHQIDSLLDLVSRPEDLKLQRIE